MTQFNQGFSQTLNVNGQSASMGAIIGAMYALDPNSDIIEKRFHDYLESEEFGRAKLDFIPGTGNISKDGEGIFYRFSYFIKKRMFYRLAITKKSFISEETFYKNISFVLADRDIKETKIRLGITALDLNSGEELLITQGPIRMAVMASAAIPGILPPISFEKRLCTDGGWSREVPIEDAYTMGADYVIGVDVGSNLRSSWTCKNSLDVVSRSNAITRSILKSKRIGHVDFILRPRVQDIDWADFKKIDRCIAEGAECCRSKIKEIEKDLKRKYFRYLIRNLFGFKH